MIALQVIIVQLERLYRLLVILVLIIPTKIALIHLLANNVIKVNIVFTEDKLLQANHVMKVTIVTADLKILINTDANLDFFAHKDHLK